MTLLASGTSGLGAEQIHLLPLILASLVLALTPGPDTLLTLRSSVHGLSHGLRYAAGAGAGIVAWSLVALVVLQAVLRQWPWVMTTVEVAGGLFLLWLGTGAVRDGLSARTQSRATPPPRRPGLTGLVSSLTNPKTGVIFIAVFPAALPDTLTPMAFAVAPSIPSLSVWLWLSLLAGLVRALGPGVQRRLTTGGFEAACGAMLLVMGAAILVSAVV